jgi:hypothetical protein
MAARRRKSRKPGAARPRRAKARRKPGAARRAAQPVGAKKSAPKPAARRARSATARPKRKQPAAPRARSERKPSAAAPKAQPASRGNAAPHLVAGAPIEVGVVLHYYPRAAAAVLALSRPIHRGDTIHVRGHTTDFVQAVLELALDDSPVAAGEPRQEVGVRMEQRARPGDRVFRVSW